MRYLYSVVFLLASQAAMAESKFDLSCRPLMSGTYSKLAIEDDTATLTFSGPSIPAKLLDLFSVPEINRSAYKAYRLKIALPAWACSFPGPFNFNGIQCKSHAPQSLKLEASLKSKADEYEYTHVAKVEKINLLLANKDTDASELVSHMITFKLLLDQVETRVGYDHECYSACTVNTLSIAAARECSI